MKSTCDCIIPFYNEGQRIFEVVNAVTKVKGLSQIILVDDGSDDKTISQKLKAQHPEIKLIRLKKNSGKAAAVKTGLKLAKSDYILLMDGDLNHIKVNEIEKVINIIYEDKNIGMIILPLNHSPDELNWFNRLYTIFSGQRILKKLDLIKIYQQKFSGFQLEAIINNYMISNKKPVYSMINSIQHFGKTKKWGNRGAIKSIISLTKEVVNCLGWQKLIFQTLFFCRKSFDR